jgi:Ni,Fe-hydrogenase maturation factor
MRTLLLACGNTLRGDDAAAHAVLDLIAPTNHHVTRAVHQLTPELAAEVARFSRVVFIDADAESNTIRIEPLNTGPARSPLTHAATPEEVVALASALFGFTGQAFVCRIPAQHFDAGEAPAPDVLEFAREAASQIAGLI